MAFHSHDSQTRSNNRWSWPRGVVVGDHDYATTRPRPRAWRPDHMHTSTAPDFFVSLFRLRPHAGKRTGHAEPARWERLKKKTRRRVRNKEWEVNGSTWSIWGISLVSSGTVVGDSSRGTCQGDPGARCCGERFPVRVPPFDSFSWKLDKMTGLQKQKTCTKEALYACVWSTCHTNKIWRRTPVLKRYFETRILKVERVGFRNENRTSSTQKLWENVVIESSPFVHAQVAQAITNFRHSGDNTVDFLHLLIAN